MKKMGRWELGIVLGVLACVPAGRAAAEEETTVVAQVRAAVRSQAGDELLRLAARDDPDPWMVVDDLLGAGDRAEAEAFAAAAPRQATRRLPEYVRVWSARENEAVTRAAFLAARDASDGASRVAGLEALGRSPDDALEVRIHLARGHALRATHVLLGSAGAFEHAAEVADRIGWRAAEADGLYEAGTSLYQQGSFEEALELLRRRLAVERALRDPVGVARGHYGLALALIQLGRGPAAERHMRDAREGIDAAGDHEYRAKLTGSDALALARAGRYVESLAGFQAALAHLDQVGKRPLAARFRASPLRLAQQRTTLLLNASSMAGQLERWDDFERLGREAIELAGRLGDEPLRLEVEAQHLTAQGVRHGLEGDDLAAEEAYVRALADQRTLGDRPVEAELLRRIAQVLTGRGDYVGALDRLEAAEDILEETGTRRPLPQILLERGTCLTMLGEYAAAHEQLLTALDLAVEIGLPLVQLDALIQLGEHHLTRGEHAEALRWFGEADALELPPEASRHDGWRAYHLGQLYIRLGEADRAEALFRQQLPLLTRPRDARLASKIRRSLLAIQMGRGDHEHAQAMLEAELDRVRASQVPLAEAAVLGLLGHLAYRQDRPADALRFWTQAEALYRDLHIPLWLARVHLDLARVHVWEKQYGKAQVRLDEALEAAERLQQTELLAHACGVQALVHLYTGDFASARAWARRGVDQAVFVGRRLAEGEGAEVRTGHWEVYETGAFAAVRSGHAEDLFFFLEAGRAATLLENLDDGVSLREEAVSSELQQQETAARTTEVRALAAYRRAVRSGVLGDIQKTRADLDAARGNLRDVALDIQRKASARGSTVLPRPVALAAARARLATDEALVLYGFTKHAPIALVVRRDGERIVELGHGAALRAEVDALLTDETPFVRPEAADALAARLVGKLALGEGIRRVLVSPDGELSRVPFALLAPEREVVLVPSASAWTLLETRPVPRGERVLAYGDPVYTEGAGGYAAGALRRGGMSELSRLPATAQEVRAVGDLVRLRGEASETRLRADLATQGRWRSVHLACHGLLDLEHPSFSSLALSTDEANDGFLTALDVYRMRIPTDLAVLSGCETGRGRSIGGEGLFGLPRAFLHAGASSVLVSLWPVDDEATQALMTRFYAAWAPKEGGAAEPLTAPAALRQAQAWVRAQPAWRHPRFWAGWVLWGRAR